VAVQIAKAIELARQQELRVPIVYNSGGYESVRTLQGLEGLVDIYMPDFKFTDKAISAQLCQAEDYVRVCKAAIKEMHRQVGDLKIKNGVATRGLLVRHLVLPNGLAGSSEVLDFLAKEISPCTFVNVMGQYRPCYRAGQFSEISRMPSREEIAEAKDYAQQLGLRLDK
jgi:putative pyruvate formate lyase activating enzyme